MKKTVLSLRGGCNILKAMGVAWSLGVCCSVAFVLWLWLSLELETDATHLRLCGNLDEDDARKTNVYSTTLEHNYMCFILIELSYVLCRLEICIDSSFYL